MVYHFNKGRGDRAMLDFKDVRIGLYNFLAVGLMALLFIVALKAVTAKWHVPGLSEIAAAA